MDEFQSLNVNDIKFQQIMKWVVQYDLEHGYNFYVGLINSLNPMDPPDISRKLRQVVREVDRVAVDEYDKKNLGKTEKDKDDERRFKA